MGGSHYSFALSVLSVAYVCDATSSGLDTTCTALANFGCTKWDQSAAEPRLACTDGKNGIMPWAAAPVRSDKYSLRAGDGPPSSDATSYWPGQLLSIYVRTLNSRYKWRGLLVHAIDEGQKTVGEWEIPADDNNIMWTPCENKGVALHVSAELKPFSVLLKWRAPAAGTGKVTFKALIKEGPANDGHFFWPGEKDLVLTEAMRPSSPVDWVLARASESCDASCESRKVKCQESLLEYIGDEAQFEKSIGVVHACNFPILSDCGAQSPAKLAKKNFCYYHDSQCAAWRKPQKATCGQVPAAGVRRYCPCATSTVTPPPTSPPSPPTSSATKSPTSSSSSSSSPTALTPGTSVSAASALSAGVAWLVGIALCLHHVSASRSKTLLLVVLACVGLPQCFAHNWLHSTGRASRQASTIRPCLARKSTDLHVQVGKGQEFAFKWATGHSGPSWVITVALKDSDKLADRDLLKHVQDYIDAAPAGSNTAQDEAHQRYHGTNKPIADYRKGGKFEKFFKKEVPVDTIFHPKAQTTALLQYNPDVIASDVRVSYKSNMYPWIESAFKFDHLEHWPADNDAFNMSIPARSGAGHYIVHWRWRGYYDCVDVDVRDQQVDPAIIYGKETVPTTYVFNRVDHCQYLDPLQLLTPFASADKGAGICKNKLPGQGAGLEKERIGINVVPLANPASVFPGIRDEVNIPTEYARGQDDAWFEAQGTATQSTVDWNLWKQRTVLSSGKTCTKQIWAASTTLKQAVARCSTSTCTGISWDGDSQLPQDGERKFFGCGEAATLAKASTGRMFAEKNMGFTPVKAAGKVIKINFSRKRDNALAADGYLNDNGGVFAKQGDYKFGWTCPAYQAYHGGVVDRASANTPENTYVRFRDYEPCNGNKYNTNWTKGNMNMWEIEVPNGVYKVTFNFARPTCTGNNCNKIIFTHCAIENVKLGKQNEVVAYTHTETVQRVPVADGRLTISANYQVLRTARFQSNVLCEYITTVEIQKVEEAMPPVWLPSSKNPWWQIQHKHPDKGIGWVYLQGLDKKRCDSRFALRGNACLEETSPAPIDIFPDPDNDGAIVGVSDTPCQGTGKCPGEVCGRVQVAWATGLNIYQGGMNVNCKGKKGKFVWVQLPGSARILSFDVKVTYDKPLTTGKGMVCYGVEARPQTATSPEFITTSDPEDPVFYSTCYVRERNVTWLDIEKTAPPMPGWRFNRKCLDCDTYQRNLAATANMFVPQWKLADKCYDCSLQQKP